MSKYSLFLQPYRESITVDYTEDMMMNPRLYSINHLLALNPWWNFNTKYPNREVDFYPVITSLVDSDKISGGLHRGFFDFDGVDYLYVRNILNEYNISGHIYKTGHGYHVYGDRLYTYSQYAYTMELLHNCEGHINIGAKRGYWGLRVGLKRDREPDIIYIEHTHNQPKDIYIKVRDAIYNRMVYLYNQTEHIRAANSILKNSKFQIEGFNREDPVKPKSKDDELDSSL